SSITPRPVIRTSSSIGGGLPLPVSSRAPVLPPTPARHLGAPLDHQPVGGRERGPQVLAAHSAAPPRHPHRLHAPAPPHPPPPHPGRKRISPPPDTPQAPLRRRPGARR